ncbi:preprotein translocase subunit SecY [Candidatus Pacearchaeota archaeon]|nr:preprotein translocase subunit SecY [Candidatus Pacearchaeota archaeon]
MALKDILMNLPEVARPTEKKLSFNIKLKWTLIVLISFFVLANISLWGLAVNSLERFEYLAVILGTDFGSIISLGIGPIVMASIILQLLVGSKILNVNTTTHEGRRYFEGLQKILTIFFVLFEGMVYVLMGGLQAQPGFAWILILQLFIGGILIVFMDEIVSKWGFGSGVSLFIAAGVGWRLFTGAFGFLSTQNQIALSGKVLVFFDSIIKANTTAAILAAATIIATIVIFLIVVYAQSIKVEVPLSFERVRGFGIRWPLALFYTSVIPVILTAALLANVQLFGRLVENAASACTPEVCSLGAKVATKFTWLGTFSPQGLPESGLAFWLHAPNLLEAIIRGSFRLVFLWQAIFHTLFFMAFSILFAVFWVRTSGMDASSQARQILASGLQIPGFRKDERILESILSRYILPLTVMGGAAIGLLAAAADLLGALVSGTAILLSVMIIYKLYEDIAQQHAYDMHPALRKFMKV